MSHDDTAHAPRRPLRPLPRILRARDRGENPDLIERAARAERRDALADRSRLQSEGRLIVLCLFFLAAFGVVGFRMGEMATSAPSEPRSARAAPAITSARADITDRDGRILATNLTTQALYAHPQDMVDIPRAVAALADIFPDLDAVALTAQLAGSRKFVWIRRTLSPEQIQAVHDIGEPGLLFASRDLRLYPNGRLAAHLLGGASFGSESVRAAEVIGVAGIERAFDERLRDPAHLANPLALSIDLPVQAAMREVLAGGMVMFGAKGASAILMDVHTGEILAMSSLPDFDPNHRPLPRNTGDRGDDPLFNRAVQGVYELGSVFKIFTMAQALEAGITTPSSLIETKTPLVWGRHRIRDFRNYGPVLTATDVIVKSSNVGTARLAQAIGPTRQRAFLDRFGFLAPTEVELFEAPSGRPLLPERWADIQSMTISYGHGLSTSPLHLAAGYAALLNGGTEVRPTLLRQDGRTLGPRLVSAETAMAARAMLRQVVSRGTASFAQVEGYAVGGKTGTADKPKPTGGYYRDRVLATFAGGFPMDGPRYAIVVTLDEAAETSGPQPRRTAGWTAVPVAAEMVRRTAPLLGIRPAIEPDAGIAIRQVSNDN